MPLEDFVQGNLNGAQRNYQAAASSQQVLTGAFSSAKKFHKRQYIHSITLYIYVHTVHTKPEPKGSKLVFLSISLFFFL